MHDCFILICCCHEMSVSVQLQTLTLEAKKMANLCETISKKQGDWYRDTCDACVTIASSSVQRKMIILSSRKPSVRSLLLDPCGPSHRKLWALGRCIETQPPHLLAVLQLHSLAWPQKKWREHLHPLHHHHHHYH